MANKSAILATAGAVNLDKVTQQSLWLTGRMLRELKRRCRNIQQLSVKELQELSGMVTKVQRAQAAMLNEARKLEKEHRDFADQMTNDEKVEFLGQVAAGLPVEARARLLEALKVLCVAGQA
jgi:hypothetical protein